MSAGAICGRMLRAKLTYAEFLEPVHQAHLLNIIAGTSIDSALVGARHIGQVVALVPPTKKRSHVRTEESGNQE